MKTAMLYDQMDLRLEDAAIPSIGDKDILVKVHSSGICGTDLHFLRMGPRYPGKPMPLGHEWAGEIIQKGQRVTKFSIGDRVAYNSNNSPADMGRGGECGGLSHFVALRNIDDHPQSLCRIPPNMSNDHAALVEPISVGTHAVNRAKLSKGETVTVFGAGPIGLGIIMTLKSRGFDDVIVFELSPLRRQLALELGAAQVYDPRVDKPSDILGAQRGHGNIWGIPHPKTDVYFEATGAAGLLSDITRFCNKGSRIITIAVHRQPLELDGTRLMSKEISIIGASGYPIEFPEIMASIAEGSINPERMITHRFNAKDFAEAFKTADTPSLAAKVILHFD